MHSTKWLKTWKAKSRRSVIRGRRCSDSVALVAYNSLSVIQRCIATVHPEVADKHGISIYYLAAEVAHCYGGLEIAVGDAYWTKRYRNLRHGTWRVNSSALLAKRFPCVIASTNAVPRNRRRR